MNRALVLATLGTAWLNTVPHESPVWEAITRECAVQTALVLLTDDGAAGWDATLRDTLARDPSPLVRQLAAELPKGRHWSALLVSTAVCQRLELWSATKDVYRSTLARLAQNGQTRPAAA